MITVDRPYQKGIPSRAGSINYNSLNQNAHKDL